jgi:signal transduction histidine kinase
MVLFAPKPFPFAPLSEAEIQGRQLADIPPPALGKSLNRMWESFRRDGDPHLSEIEIGLETGDGADHLCFSVRAAPHPDRPDLCIITLRDLRRQRTQVRDLLDTIDALRLQGNKWEETARSTAHDVRSSLSAMTGFIQLALNDQDHLSRESKDNLERALGIGKRLQDLLLFLQKSQSPRNEEGEKVAIGPLGHRLFLALTAACPGETFNWHVECGDETVSAPSTVIWNALWNLLINSVKYRKPNHLLEIGLRSWTEAGIVHMEVQDSGRGIPAGQEEAIFHWGKRCVEPHEVEGSGLGLPSARQLIESWGGKMWAEPSLEGASIRLTLPA